LSLLRIRGKTAPLKTKGCGTHWLPALDHPANMYASDILCRWPGLKENRENSMRHPPCLLRLLEFS